MTTMMSDVKIEATGPEPTKRVLSHPIERDTGIFHVTERFTEVDRRPYELVRERHDRALQANRETPHPPFIGESVNQYDRRLTHQLMKHGTTYGVMGTLERTPQKLFEDMRDTITREAIQAPARRGEVVEINYRDRTGRNITEFEGVVNWLNPFKGPIQVGGIPDVLAENIPGTDLKPLRPIPCFG